MFDRASATRPAQVNACFEGGSPRQAEIVAALKEAGLRDEQITVIDRADPEATKVATAEPSFLDRLKSLFGGDHDQDERMEHYDLLVLAHLGEDEDKATAVQEVFQRFGASRVSYYPSAQPEMHVLGGGDAPPGAPAPGATGTAGEAIGRDVTGASGVPAPTTRDAGARVEPGALPADQITHLHGPTASRGTVEDDAVVYHAEPRVTEPGDDAETPPGPPRA